MKVVPMKHVAVLAFPFGSHAGPLLNLVQGIAAEAPQVTFSFFNTSRSNAFIFTGQNKDRFENIKPYNVHDGLPEGYVPSGHPLEPMNLFIKDMRHNYRRAMDEVVAQTGMKFTCLVTDAFLWFGADMAEEMQVNWIPFWIAGPHSVLAHVFTDLVREKVASSGGNYQAQNIDFLPGFSSVKASDLPEGILGDIEQPFPIMLYKMTQALPSATAVAINSFDELNPLVVKELESKFQKVLNIGPINSAAPQLIIPDELECLKWLDKHEAASVIYISFGSVILPPPHELTALAEALEECGFPFIWAFRGNPEKQLPNGFLERTRTKGKVVASWAPQMEILKHPAIGVCVQHSGWNSISECIVGGVPMICRPFFADQHFNTYMLESVWGIGVPVNDNVFTKEATMIALKSTMSSEKGKIMRQKMVELKKTAMEAVGPDGSSTGNFRTLIQIVTS